MPRTILITGSTDGIGLEAAKLLVMAGHQVSLHGRNRHKLAQVAADLGALPGGGVIDTFVGDLSRMADVVALADEIIGRHDHLDVLINNAGVFHTNHPVTADGLDVRFAVNTIAPYLLTRRIGPLLGAKSRVINVSSAAQAPVNPSAIAGKVQLSDGEAYSQSKLALTMWSNHLATEFGSEGPVVVAVNPGSMLGTKMVKEGFGVPGNDIGIGADILARAALSEEFESASGTYYDNDAHAFGSPHPDALDDEKNEQIVSGIDAILAKLV